jgi:hypothetical protein
MVNVTKKQDEPAQPDLDAGTHVESLESIAALGSQLEAPAGAPGEVRTDQDEAAEIAVALQLLRAAALPFAPDHVQEPLALVWSDKQLTKVAEAIVELCKFHGWTVGDFFTEYGPYLQLAMALGMPLLATIKLLKMPPPPKDGQQQQA